MRDLALNLHVASTVLLWIGFAGLAAFFLVVNYTSLDGGANIGLGLISLLSLAGGAIGTLVALVALVLAALSRRKSI